MILASFLFSVLMFGSLLTSAASVKAPADEGKEINQIEIPSSYLVLPEIEDEQKKLEEIKRNGLKLQMEQEKEELRIELKKAHAAEESRLAKIEAERKAKEEAERLVREKKERERLKDIAAKKDVSEDTTEGVAFNGSYYTSGCNGCSGITATGINVKNTIYYKGMRIIAVDPKIIPLYSIVQVKTPHETFKAIALDKGGAIKGHKVDILVADKKTAYNLGRHTVNITVLKKGK